MNPVKVFTKAIVVFEGSDDPSRCYIATFVDGKVSASYPHRPKEEALAFAERLANNEAELELARLTCSSRIRSPLCVPQNGGHHGREKKR